jgi:PAS domain-containing protein
VWIAAPDGKGTFINRAWTEYLGLSLAEILGFCQRSLSQHQ